MPIKLEVPYSDKDKVKAAPPIHLYGHDLRVRAGGEKDFKPETPRIGVELFKDDNTRAIIAISDAGSLAVIKVFLGVYLAMLAMAHAYTAPKAFAYAIAFGLALLREADQLRLVVRGWSAFGIPLPRALAPFGEAYESAERGRFHFHVEIRLPPIGLIVGYRGWLVPLSRGHTAPQ